MPRGGARLLELGAGAGRNTPRYAGFEHVVLVDYSRTQLEQALQRLGAGPRYTFVAADIYRLPFAPSAFPATTMIRTLHHMVDAAGGAAPGARLPGLRRRPSCSSSPTNAISNPSLAGCCAARRGVPFDRAPVEFAALNFDFHPDAIDDWLRACRLALERRLTVSHFRLALLKRLLPLPLLVGMDSLAQWTGGLCQLTPSVFLRARAVGPDDPAPAGALWRCPACASLNVRQHLEGVDCLGCRRTWPLRDGIYDFRDQPA